jgi:uncharacterized protein (DUF983 family)
VQFGRNVEVHIKLMCPHCRSVRYVSPFFKGAFTCSKRSCGWKLKIPNAFLAETVEDGEEVKEDG